MRTTVRIDDELLERLKALAQREKVSLTRVVNRTLQAGMRAAGKQQGKRPVYRQRTYSLGAPLVSLDKALALAAALEDDEIARKVALRK